MGKAISRLRGSMVTRPLQRFNAESRAEKVISMEKPRPAPKYTSDAALLETLHSKDPHLSEGLHAKDISLQDRLEKVYVTSHDPPAEDQNDSGSQTKPLPQRHKDFHQRYSFDYHVYSDPTVVAKAGKVTLLDAQKILLRFGSGDDSKETVAELAKEFSISEDSLASMVRHFAVFNRIEGISQSKKNKQSLGEKLGAGSDWVYEMPKKLSLQIDAGNERVGDKGKT